MYKKKREQLEKRYHCNLKQKYNKTKKKTLTVVMKITNYLFVV